MITDGKKYHYLAVTNLSALLQRMSSTRDGDFYCLNCFNPYTTKNKIEEHKEICNNHDSYHIEMPKQAKKILKYIYGKKSLKAPFPVYLDLECLLKKEQSCQKNSEKSYPKKKAVHEPSSWTMFTSCSFDEKENKLPKEIPVIIHNASYDTHFILTNHKKNLNASLIVYEKTSKSILIFCIN